MPETQQIDVHTNGQKSLNFDKMSSGCRAIGNTNNS